MKKEISINTRYCLIILIVLIIQSCASFDKELLNPNHLNKQNLKELDGTYDIATTQQDSLSLVFQHKTWLNNNFFTEIDRKLITDTLKLDSLNTYNMKLKVLNPKELEVSYVSNRHVFRKRIIKTKLKKDGYLYLKNKNIQFLLVPYVFGAMDVKRVRLTKSVDENLIFDVTNHRSGAALLVMFLNGSTSKYRKEYKQAKNNEDGKETI